MWAIGSKMFSWRLTIPSVYLWITSLCFPWLLPLFWRYRFFCNSTPFCLRMLCGCIRLSCHSFNVCRLVVWCTSWFWCPFILDFPWSHWSRMFWSRSFTIVDDTIWCTDESWWILVALKNTWFLSRRWNLRCGSLLFIFFLQQTRSLSDPNNSFFSV